jgi:hypothetical protein
VAVIRLRVANRLRIGLKKLLVLDILSASLIFKAGSQTADRNEKFFLPAIHFSTSLTIFEILTEIKGESAVRSKFLEI